MDEWTGIAIGAFALSSFVSALRLGHWILNADPRALLNAGRWSLILIAVLTLAALVWLVAYGKWTPALMLAAFVLPVLVQAAPRWRVLLGPFSNLARGSSSISPDRSPGGRPANGFYTAGFIDPELAQRSAAILQAYLEQSSRYAGTNPSAINVNTPLINGSINGFQPKRMSTAEALAVLGLDPTAGESEIKKAYQCLEAKLAPELGGSSYFTQKINEAREILLGD
jgi:hypothetical protein